MKRSQALIKDWQNVPISSRRIKGGIYKRPWDIYPSEAEHKYKLGLAHLLKNNPCAAAIAFARAIKLKPNYFEAYDELAVVYRKYGYHDSAIEVLRRRLEICDDNTGAVYGAIARSLIYRERYEEAVAAYRRAAEIDLHSADWRHGEGEALAGAGHYEEAIRAYRQALEIAPHDMNALISIACAYEHMGEHEQSDKVIERMSVILREDDSSLESLAHGIKSEIDLGEFINSLLNDLSESPNGWNNLSLTAFLEGLRGSLAEGYDDYYGVRNLPNFDWKALGHVLLAARSYE
jgi:tetratricopeptide (TPR) repeat protein